MKQVPSSAALRDLLKLTERREALLEELAAIEEKITASLDGRAPAAEAKVPKAAGKPKAKGKRNGKAKEAMLALLREAGTKGISVKDIVAKTGRNSSTVHVWFATTGKKYAEKVASGVYRLKAGVA